MELIQAHSSNYQAGRTSAIKYICIHYTANANDTARNNCKYFQTANRKASAHYFVDEREIIQSVKEADTAWAVGDGNGKYGITNANSISIEMCNSLTYNPAVEALTVAFVNELLLKHPNAQVARHYDASRKVCPKYYTENPTAWENFKTQIKGGLTMSQYEELKKMIEGLRKDVQTYLQYNNIGKPASDWAKETWDKATASKIVDGTNPQSPLTREQLVVILDRIGVIK